MKRFIKNIRVNSLLHLKDFDIPISNTKSPHLIITGKNGSGKTILLNAISESLNIIKNDKSVHFLSYEKWIKDWEQKLSYAVSEQDKMRIQEELTNCSRLYNAVFGKVTIYSDCFCDIIDKYNSENFVIAFYQAYRKVEMQEPKNPTKPVYKTKGDIKESVTSQFLNFLSDLKIQEALARNEEQFSDADMIKDWFVNFEGLLSNIFQDKSLKLEFNYKDYSFKINTQGKSFKFTEVSDGFAAALDIVADLILKMQNNNTLVRSYQKEGIVLIDEIETHLHLALQKVIMPLLTRVFPNIQFIITTHSPFILSSMPNAVAYDLERREILKDLTEYSYESLAEGYFGVKTQSSYSELQIETFKNLLSKDRLSEADKIRVKQMIDDFDKISETISPLVVGEYRQLAIKYADKINEL